MSKTRLKRRSLFFSLKALSLPLVMTWCCETLFHGAKATVLTLLDGLEPPRSLAQWSKPSRHPVFFEHLFGIERQHINAAAFKYQLIMYRGHPKTHHAPRHHAPLVWERFFEEALRLALRTRPFESTFAASSFCLSASSLFLLLSFILHGSPQYFFFLR